MKKKNLSQIVGGILFSGFLAIASPQNTKSHDLNSPYLGPLDCYSVNVIPIDDEDSKYYRLDVVAGVYNPSKENAFSLKIKNEDGEILFSVRSTNYVSSTILPILKSDVVDKILDVYTIILEPLKGNKILDGRFTVIYNNGKSIVAPTRVIDECI